MAVEMLERIAAGEDPVVERALRTVPTLREALEAYLADPGRNAGTATAYRQTVQRYLGIRLARSLNTVTHQNIEPCFPRLNAEAGWMPANNAVRVLGALYRWKCVDIGVLHDAVEQSRAAGGRLHRPRHRRLRRCSAPGARASRERCTTRTQAMPSSSASTPG